MNLVTFWEIDNLDSISIWLILIIGNVHNILVDRLSDGLFGLIRKQGLRKLWWTCAWTYHDSISCLNVVISSQYLCYIITARCQTLRVAARHRVLLTGGFIIDCVRGLLIACGLDRNYRLLCYYWRCLRVVNFICNKITV